MAIGGAASVPRGATEESCMMSFGWRPNQSCYQAAQQLQPASAPPCGVPTWFWLALGVAAVAGLSNKK